MESLLKNLKEYVTCSICLDTFTDPKTISCLHTFCCECLKQYSLTSQRDGQFRCPECQAQVCIPERNGFDKLPTALLESSLLDCLAVQPGGDGSEISCVNCRKKSAEASFCFNCGTFLCPDCVKAHELLRNIAFEGHKVTQVKQFQTEDYDNLVKTCLKRQSFCSQQHHEREVTGFFCLECQTCVCQICIGTNHENHTVDPLDKVAADEKAKIMAEAELMKEKIKVCNDVIREFEQTAHNLETNIANAKREVYQTADQMITMIRQRERETITALENTRVSRMKKLDFANAQVHSLAKQINRAVEFANNLIQRSSNSDIMRGHKNFEQRFEDLHKTPVPALPVSSSVKFVETYVPENLAFGFMATIDPIVKGLNQDFQAGVEAELIICPKVTSEAQEKVYLNVVVEPAEKVRSLMTCRKDDGNLLVKFTPKEPGKYNIKVTLNWECCHKSCFTVQVKERRVEVLGELERKLNSEGIAVNSKGLIAVADCKSHCILIFDKDGKYLRKLGCKGENAGELDYPTGITYLNDNELLVADFLNHRIQQFNVHTGKFVKTFGKKGTGKGELQNPRSLCMDGEGRVVVADCVNNRMQVFTRDGTPVFNFGSGKLDHPSGCIFHQNMFIICDTYNDCLKIFDCSGTLLRKIGSKGKGDGQLIRPQGLCIEKCGNHHNIVVCDSGNGRIVQFSVEGSFIGKTVTKLQDPIAIAATPDGRILVSDFEAPKIYILKVN